MESTDAIGNVDKIILKTKDANENVTETTVTSKKLKANPEATYQQIDTAMRALNSLSDDSYNDTILVTNISVNEVMA